jgi:Fe-Mn family superoxide dismutase
MAFELPPLPYDYSALEPTIDAATMKLHHDMHHAAYVKNLNAALEKHPNLQSKSAEDLIRDLNALPEDIRGAVRNKAGTSITHVLEDYEAQRRRRSSGPIAEASRNRSVASRIFQLFNDAEKQFGSGWAAGREGRRRLQILAPNQTTHLPGPVSHFRQ